MSESLASATSYNLLGLLANNTNDTAWNDAWHRFAAKYDRAIRVWGTRYGCPVEDLPGLVQEVLIRLHHAMVRWEIRAWLRCVARAATAAWITESKGWLREKANEPVRVGQSPNGQGEAAEGRGEAAVDKFIQRLLSQVEDEVLDALANRRVILDQATDDAAREAAWGSFADAYRPTVARAFKAYECGPDSPTDTVDQWLGHLRGAWKPIELPRFRSWLHMVVRNAAIDCLRSEVRARSLGAARLEAISVDIEARDAFVDAMAEREVLEELFRRVRVRADVSDRDWAIFSRQLDREITGDQVATEFGVSVAVVHKVASRVRKVFRAERERLNTECDGPTEE